MAQPLKVLIVDDSPMDRQLIRGLLERHGIEVVEAASAEEAADRVDAATRVIVLDLTSSQLHLSGVRVVELVSAASPLPIVVCTGDERMDTCRQVSVFASVQAYVPKQSIEALPYAVVNSAQWHARQDSGLLDRLRASFRQISKGIQDA